MFLKRILSNKSFLDFFVMFLSNIMKKGIGFFREVILALVFGSSIIYANFLLLKSAADLFSLLTQGNALQANLLAKFSKLYDAGIPVSLSNVLSFSKRMMLNFFLLSQLIQLPIVWYIQPDNYLLFILISILLGVIVSVSFYSSIFLVIMQGKDEFKKHSIATTLDLFSFTLVLYPLSILFGVLGIVLSRLVGLFIMFGKFIRPITKEVAGEPATFNIKDFNISVMLLGNFAHVILLLSRFVAGLDAGNNITFYNYSVVLLNVMLTVVILNLNTIVLRRLSIKKDIKLIFFSAGVALILGLGLVYFINAFGFEVIQLIFQRGAFTLEDSMKTFEYAKDLSLPFVFIFIATALFQPFFTLKQEIIKRMSRNMALGLLSVVAALFVSFQFLALSARENSLIMMYVLSVVSMLLSFVAVYKYLKFENKNIE